MHIIRNRRDHSCYQTVLIAAQATLRPINEIASSLGIEGDELIPYGSTKAKVNLKALENRKDQPDGKLILVTAMTPTKYGEGKTTTSIGMGQAFGKLNKRALIAIREPSLGPIFGIKGGATGGGYAQVIPMDDINMHFTGDFAAIEKANKSTRRDDRQSHSLWQQTQLRYSPNHLQALL